MTTNEPSLHELLPGTSTEKNLAEDWAAVVEKFSALAGAVEDGNWRYAHEKIENVRRALASLEYRISRQEGGEDDRRRVYENPKTDPHRINQLVIAFAQQWGGRLGPLIHPIDGLENEQAKESIARSLKWRKDFAAALDAGDSAEASRLTGREVRIVDMDGQGDATTWVGKDGSDGGR